MCIRFPVMSDIVKLMFITTITLSCVYPGSDAAHRLQAITGCIKRGYMVFVNKTTAIGGIHLPCEGHVKVVSCWGRCDSFEYGDYKLPYKISHHPVCTYEDSTPRKVTIPNCHIDHPDPSHVVFDASACLCKECDSDTTSCENLKG